MENNILAGNHSVTVTDINNCSETMSIELVEPDELIVNGSSQLETIIHFLEDLI